MAGREIADSYLSVSQNPSQPGSIGGTLTSAPLCAFAMTSKLIASLPLGLFLCAAGSLHAQPIPCSEVTELNTVFFDFTADTLSDEGRARLDENLTLLGPCPEWGILVEGYTDNVEENRLTLSQRRAEAVLHYYLDHRIEAGRIAVRGRGEDPDSFEEGDPGPGDRNARRAASLPIPLAELPAVRGPETPADPPPYTEHITYDIAFTVDWAPYDERVGDDCPEALTAGASNAPAYMLHEAVLTVEDETFVLDVACLSAARTSPPDRPDTGSA